MSFLQVPSTASSTNYVDPTRYKLVEVIFDAITGSSEEDFRYEQTEAESEACVRIYGNLQSYSLELLRELADLHGNNPYKFDLVTKVLEGVEEEAFVSNYIRYGDVADARWDYMDISIARSIQYYPQFAKYQYDLRNAPVEVQKGARALLEVAHHVYRMLTLGEYPVRDGLKVMKHDSDYQLAPVISDPEMVDYIMSNRSKTDDIIASIERTKAMDPKRIEVIANHPERVLSDGAL